MSEPEPCTGINEDTASTASGYFCGMKPLLLERTPCTNLLLAIAAQMSFAQFRILLSSLAWKNMGSKMCTPQPAVLRRNFHWFSRSRCLAEVFWTLPPAVGCSEKLPRFTTGRSYQSYISHITRRQGQAVMILAVLWLLSTRWCSQSRGWVTVNSVPGDRISPRNPLLHISA